MKLLSLLACSLLCATLCRGAELLVRTDAECRLTVDGVASGIVKTSGGVRLTLPPGEHKIEAVSVTGATHWRKTIQLAALDERQEVSIPLRAAIAAAKTASSAYWIDPATHLMWTAADNGVGVSLLQAVRYCRGLKLGGFDDWALPSIDDLQGILGSLENQGGYHVKGALKLSGWQWSSTPGKQESEGWAFDFGDGGRASVAAGDSGLNRALCIRRADDKPR